MPPESCSIFCVTQFAIFLKGARVTTSEFASTSFVITLPAPTDAISFTVTGATKTELDPVFAPSLIIVLLLTL